MPRSVIVKVTAEVFDASFRRLVNVQQLGQVDLQDDEDTARAIDFALELMPPSTEWEATPAEYQGSG